MPTGVKMLLLLKTENLKNHTLSRSTYLYSQYVGVPPPEAKVKKILNARSSARSS